MAQSGEYVSRGPSGSVGHGGRNGFGAVERSLDCWNCGADRGSVNIGRTGAERSSYPLNGADPAPALAEPAVVQPQAQPDGRHSFRRLGAIRNENAHGS